MMNELTIVAVENYPDKNDYFDGYRIERLSNGWYWHQYYDGSGSLHIDEKTSYFSYDKQPYASQDGIEYVDLGGHWTVFWGTFSEFKRYMEQNLLKYLSAA